MIREKLAARRAVEASGFRSRGGDPTRLEQFSDVVFAVSLALLVVSLDVPRTVPELLTVLRQFPAFGITFAVFTWIWYSHYVYCRRYGLTDALTTALNGVLLFLVLFYSYPLRFMFGALFDGLMGRGLAFTFAEGRVLLVVYSLGFIGVFAMLALLYLHALRLADELELNAAEVLVTRATMQAHLLVVAVGTLCCALAGVGPAWALPLAGFGYAAIGPVMWLHWSRVSRQFDALGAS
jgi:uncharacterized membrane protein